MASPHRRLPDQLIGAKADPSLVRSLVLMRLKTWDYRELATNRRKRRTSEDNAQVVLPCLVVVCDFRMIKYHPHPNHQRPEKRNMHYRIVAALFLLVASATASSAQGLWPSVWQGRQGALLKVLTVDPAGNFGGVFISNPAGPCPAVPYNLAGRVRGPGVAFQTSRNWTADCRVTAVWTGRLVNPTTIATTWVATTVAPNGRVVRTRGTDVFRRL
jgi:hypothetical protein